LIAGLAARRANGDPPYTVLSCDNLSGNGSIARQVVLDFASEIDSDLARWIEEEVCFPNTMVDRITPAPTDETYASAKRFTGLEDRCAVEAEQYSQWVIEDMFTAGRPDWDAAGAQFTTHIAPFENMKLRMLNGAHSMLAYSGYVAGHKYVSDVMNDLKHRRLVESYIRHAALSLVPPANFSLEAYGNDLCKRFSNASIKHETKQIAADGSAKLPQRIFDAALSAADLEHTLSRFAFATAAWMRFCLGRDDAGNTYEIVDPRSDEITARIFGLSEANEIYAALSGLTGFFPDRLLRHEPWKRHVVARLNHMLKRGMRSAIEEEIRKDN
jgi:fructuronate reductase